LIRSLVSFLATSLLAAAVLFADPHLETALSGRWGSRGVARALVVQPGRVLAADGRGLAVYDTSTSLRQITSFVTARRSLDIAAAENDVFLLTEGGIERLRLSGEGTFVARVESIDRPNFTAIATNGRFTAAVGPDVELWENGAHKMHLAGNYALRTRALSAAFHGDRLYVVVENEGILIFDPAAAGALTPLATIGTPSVCIAISGDRLYVAAAGSGLLIYDISDDENPVRLSHIGELVDYQYIAVSGNLAFAGELPDKTSVYDVSSPVNPRLLSTIHDPVSVLAAAGNRLYLAGQLIDKYDYTNETGAQLQAWDLTSPSSPVPAGEIRDGNLAGPLSGVATDGRYAYVADPPRFRVIDLTFPNAPREAASIEVPGLQDYVRIQGRTAAVYGRHSVNLIDISDPAHPRSIGGWDSLGAPPSTAAFAGGHVVEGNPWSGFHLLDVTNPLDPIQIGGYKGHYYSVAAVEEAAYTSELNTVRVMDLTTPTNVQIAGFLPAAGKQVETAPASPSHPRLLYVVTAEGVHLFTLDDPLHPAEAAMIPLPAGGVLGAGADVAFYAVGGAVYRLDVSNPASPLVTLTNIQVSNPRQIGVAGDKLVIADSYWLQVYGDAPVVKRRVAGKR
jgi:hypothetical protein